MSDDCPDISEIGLGGGRYLHPMLSLAAIALLSAALAACAALGNLSSKAAERVESLTGLRCRVASVGPCLPCGIAASDVTICSPSGVQLFQAREVRARVDLFRYLRTSGEKRDLFHTVSGDQVQLTLIRKENGEWEFPRLTGSSGRGASISAGNSSPRRLLFTNVTIVVKTSKGESSRFYRSLEINRDPGRNSVSLQLEGVDESAGIQLTAGPVKRYEFQAENFSPALLTPLPAFPPPLADLALTGKLSATTRDNRKFAITGSGRITTQGVHSPVVSSRPIEGFSLPFDLQGVFTGSGIESLVARVGLAGETAFVQGSVRGWDKPVIDLTATFSDFSYDRAIAAVPPSLHPNLPRIRLSGSMTGTFGMHLDLADPGSLDCSYSGRTQRLKVLDLGHDLEHLKGPFLHKVRMNPEQETFILVSPDNPDFTPYHSIPFSVRSAVLAAEDPGFFSHHGFSTGEFRGALIENLKAGRVVRGASTISMQLAKNLFLSPERTVSRKLEEALITIALEQHLDKRRILEIYLNIIEWGNGIYGIGPAARYYFGKSPAQLSATEAAFLASIIARPKNWSPDPLPRLGRGWRHYLGVILGRMYRMGAVDVEDLRYTGGAEEQNLMTEGDPSVATEGASYPAADEELGIREGLAGTYGGETASH